MCRLVKQVALYMLANSSSDPDFALYCCGQPHTSIHEQSICFDTKVELDSFVDRKDAVKQQLTS